MLKNYSLIAEVIFVEPRTNPPKAAATKSPESDKLQVVVQSWEITELLGAQELRSYAEDEG